MDLQWNWWECRTPNAVPLWDVLTGIPDVIRHLIAHPHFGFVPRQAQFLYICLVSAIAFGVVRILSKNFVFPHLAWLCGVPRNPVKINKFSYQMWLILYYTTTSVVAVKILLKYPWWGAPLKCDANAFLWVNYPLEIPDDTFRWYYLLQAGFYIEEFIATCMESKRADFWEYIIHHVVTLSLVVGSFMSLDMRVGSLVFLYHDIPDIFLCAAKLCNYARRETFCNLFFVGFVISFAFFRLYLFPGIIWTSWTVGLTTRPLSISAWTLSGFLSFGLIPLHLYWYVLILRMLVRVLLVDRTVTSDIRSDDEEEDEEDKKKPKKPKAVSNDKKPKEPKEAKEAKREHTNGDPPSPKAKPPAKKRASKAE